MSNNAKHVDYRKRCPKCNQWIEFRFPHGPIGQIVACDSCRHQWLATEDCRTGYAEVHEVQR